ncbi:MAG: GNAT family N-acetyltransferase [Lachnospiraceae bacterium]|nr:GNAT family N-acetyltransferase [Lachnospiraceae bacterium]
MDSMYHFRIAEMKDAETVHQIMQRVHDLLEDPSLYVCDDLPYVKEQIAGKGFVVIAEDEQNRPAGIFLFQYPGNGPENLGRDIGLPETEWEHVVHLDSAAVLPEHRGQNLQYRMLRQGEELIDKTRYHHFLATVSPDNPASFRTLEKAGYSLMVTKEKYGGKMRRIYYKKMDTPYRGF